MRATFSPAFLSIPHPSEQAPQAAGSHALVSFSSKYANIDAFVEHADFSVFKRQFTEAIQCVVDFSYQHALKVSPALSPQSLAKIKENFTEFKTNLFVASHFGIDRSVVYGTGKEYFDQFCSLLQNEKIPLQARLGAIVKLAQEITLCSGGIVTGLQHAVSTMKASGSGIVASARWRKSQLAENLALHFVKKNHQYIPGNEVHLVNAHLNYSADTLGIAPREDPFAARMHVKPEKLEASKNSIERELTPLRLATVMADDYLSQIREVAATKLEDVSLAIPHAKLDQVTAAIGVHQDATLNAQYGEVLFNDFLLQDAPDSDQYRIARSPALITRRLIEKLRDHKIVNYDDAVILAQAQNTKEKIMQLDSLFWRQTGGDCEPLPLADLCRVRPSEMLSTLKKNPTVRQDEYVSILENVARHVLENSEREGMTALPDRWLEDFTETLGRLGQSDIKGLGTSLMMLAVRFDQPVDLQALLKAGVDKDVITSKGDTLLLAARHGRMDMLRTLLAIGADIKVKTSSGYTPLMLAAENGHIAALEALLAKGANVEAKLPSGATPLILAVENGHIAVIEALLAKRANVNAELASGYTPLMVATRNRHIAALEALLAKGANVEAKLPCGHTPLTFAAEHGDIAVLDALLAKGANVETKLESGATALIFAAANGHIAVIESLLAKGANVKAKLESGHTPLMIAVQNGHVAASEALLAKGADVEAKFPSGHTPLMCAAERGDIAMLEVLLARGAKVKAKAIWGGTPLICAARSGNIEAVKLLLDAGADKKTRTFFMGTAHKVAKNCNHSRELIDLLTPDPDLDPRPGTNFFMGALQYFRRANNG